MLVITTVSFLTVLDGTALLKMTHELNITETKCGKNTTYLCLFQEYYDNMKQQYKHCFCLFSNTKTRGIFTCLQGVGTGAFFYAGL
jgi:hypothetical protein